MRNERFLADLMARARSFRQEMRRSKPVIRTSASSGVRISSFRRRRIFAQFDRLDFKLAFEGDRGPPRVGTAGANDFSRPTAF